MSKSLNNLMQAYCQKMVDLQDYQGELLITQMAHIAIQSRRHSLYIHPFEQSVLPAVFYIQHAEYILDRFCAQFPASLNHKKINARKVINARLNLRFDFSLVTTSNNIPYQVSMRLDRITKSTNVSPFFTQIETVHHHETFKSSLCLNLSSKEITQAQHPIEPWYPNLPTFKARHDAFYALLNPQRFLCQGCGFPTLPTSNDYEYCLLCDLMDMSHLEANIHSKLFMERQNFELFSCAEDLFDIRRPAFQSRLVISPQALANKHKLVQAYLALLPISNQQDFRFAVLWENVLQCEQVLDI